MSTLRNRFGLLASPILFEGKKKGMKEETMKEGISDNIALMKRPNQNKREKYTFVKQLYFIAPFWSRFSMCSICAIYMDHCYKLCIILWIENNQDVYCYCVYIINPNLNKHCCCMFLQVQVITKRRYSNISINHHIYLFTIMMYCQHLHPKGLKMVKVTFENVKCIQTVYIVYIQHIYSIYIYIYISTISTDWTYH